MRASCSVTVMASTSSSCPAATSGWEKSPNATGRWESLTRHCPRAPSASIQRTRTEVGCPQPTTVSDAASVSGKAGRSWTQRERHGILSRSQRWRYWRAMSVTSRRRSSSRVIGSRPRSRSCRFSAKRSLRAASLRGLSKQVDVRSGDSGDQLGEVDDSVYLGHLVEDPDALAALRRVLDGELDAADAVLEVDEGARLAARAVHGERVADGGLHEEPVEDRAVVAVVVEAVDQPLVEPGLVGLGAPDDALVQVGHADARRSCCRTRRAAGPGSWSCGRRCRGPGEEDLLLDLAAVVASIRTRR